MRALTVCISAVLVLISAPVLATTAIVDDWQRTVFLPKAPQRIVSLSAHLTELIFEAGLGDKLIAVDLHSDFPLQVKQLPRLNVLPEPNLEALLKLKPDLVLLWGQGLKRATVERLENFGLRVWVSDPSRIEQIPQTLERLAGLAKPNAIASDLASQQTSERAKSLREKITQSKAPVTASLVPVFMQVWQQPLMTVGRNTMISDALRHCAAHAVLSNAVNGSGVVSTEAVLRAAPVAIVTSNEQEARSYWKGRLNEEQYRKLQYIVVEANALQRPSARLIDALAPLCRKIDALRNQK